MQGGRYHLCLLRQRWCRQRASRAPPRNHQASLYQSNKEEIPILIKVEIHNHPTAVSPSLDAAAEPGGEIRDEGVVAREARIQTQCLSLWVPSIKRPHHRLRTNLGDNLWDIASAVDCTALARYFRTLHENVAVSCTLRGG